MPTNESKPTAVRPTITAATAVQSAGELRVHLELDIPACQLEAVLELCAPLSASGGVRPAVLADIVALREQLARN